MRESLFNRICDSACSYFVHLCKCLGATDFNLDAIININKVLSTHKLVTITFNQLIFILSDKNVAVTKQFRN